MDIGRKKVLFISAASNIHTVRWVNVLSEEFEVHLAYCSDHKPSIDVINEKVVLHELKYKAPFGYYLNSFQLRKIYKDIKPDIINVHYASGYGTLARVSKIKPVLLSVWGSDVYDFPNESKLKRIILKRNVLYAKEIASTSNAMAKQLKKVVPELEKEVYITPFGVDINRFNKMNIQRDNDDFNIGIIKTLKEKYGIKYAILAIEELKNRLIEKNKKELAERIKLYIYGDGEQKESLQKLINDKRLNDSVVLMGKIPNNEVPNALNKFDVFCATSVLNSESFGVAVVEAMSCGIPVVATKTDGFSEVMVDKETGYLVEMKNVEQIVDSLENLLENESLREIMGNNGRKRVNELYNWQENANYMKKIYYDVIRSNERK